MKKNLIKITVITAGALGITAFIVLLATAYGFVSVNDYFSRLVRIMLWVLGGCYVLAVASSVILAFGDSLQIKEVQVAVADGSTVKVTPSVIRRLVRKSIAPLKGISLKKVVVRPDELGIGLDVTVACYGGKTVTETGAFVQNVLGDALFKNLGFKPNTVNVKVDEFVGAKKSKTPEPEVIPTEEIDAIDVSQEVLGDNNAL